ncbi:SDR family oxidoreductase [Micromonospora chalcea]|uniref:SDR family oxidoreductase n=1 Tax=Micromonospora chalcea TaxID=1874 RepID=UPI00331E640A
MEYVSRVPRPPLDGLIDDLYYLAGTPPYPRLTLPPMPAALLIVNLGAPFRVRGGTDVETTGYADGCVITTPTRAFEFGYPRPTRSVGVHVKPWGLAPFLPMPAAELRDRPVTLEQVWGRPAVADLRDRLATADGPHKMLALLEEELVNIGSNTAERAVFPGFSLYAMSKTALIGLTKALGRELGGRAITVNLVNPGATDTELNPADGPNADTINGFTALGHYAQPADVAAAVAFLAGPDGRYVTGATVNVDGGFTI